MENTAEIARPGSFSCRAFMRDHLGTDMLLASWLLLVSSAVYVGVICYYLTYAVDDYDDDFYFVNDLCLLFSAVAYLAGAGFFVYISYPDELRKLMAEMEREMTDGSIEKMPFWERYVTGNSLLLATWLFLVATLPILVYPIWAYSIAYITALYFAVCIIAAFVVFLGLSLWVYACMPENLVKNEGRGSDVFARYVAPFIFCCASKEWITHHMSPDFLAGSWFFAAMAFFGVIGVIYLIACYPSDFIYYLYFISVFLFFVGGFIFAWSSYPGANISSNTFYKMLCCDGAYEAEAVAGYSTERTKLIPPSQSSA